MTRRKLLKSICGAAAAVAVLPALPAIAEKKYGRIPCRSPLGRKVSHVTCDGYKVNWAFDADDREGWVDYFVMEPHDDIDWQGKPTRWHSNKRDAEGKGIRQRVYGDVKYHWKDGVA